MRSSCDATDRKSSRRLIALRSASSARFWSSMSVAVPIHPTIVPFVVAFRDGARNVPAVAAVRRPLMRT